MQPIRAKQEWARHQRPHRASHYVVLLSMQIAGIHKMKLKLDCRLCKTKMLHKLRQEFENLPQNAYLVECEGCGVLGIKLIARWEVYKANLL